MFNNQIKTLYSGCVAATLLLRAESLPAAPPPAENPVPPPAAKIASLEILLEGYNSNIFMDRRKADFAIRNSLGKSAAETEILVKVGVNGPASQFEWIEPLLKKRDGSQILNSVKSLLTPRPNLVEQQLNQPQFNQQQFYQLQDVTVFGMENSINKLFGSKDGEIFTRFNGISPDFRAALAADVGEARDNFGILKSVERFENLEVTASQLAALYRRYLAMGITCEHLEDDGGVPALTCALSNFTNEINLCSDCKPGPTAKFLNSAAIYLENQAGSSIKDRQNHFEGLYQAFSNLKDLARPGHASPELFEFCNTTCESQMEELSTALATKNFESLASCISKSFALKQLNNEKILPKCRDLKQFDFTSGFLKKIHDNFQAGNITSLQHYMMLTNTAHDLWKSGANLKEGLPHEMLERAGKCAEKYDFEGINKMSTSMATYGYMFERGLTAQKNQFPQKLFEQILKLNDLEMTAPDSPDINRLNLYMRVLAKVESYDIDFKEPVAAQLCARACRAAEDKEDGKLAEIVKFIAALENPPKNQVTSNEKNSYRRLVIGVYVSSENTAK
jgi:hypothetical protein